MKKVVVSSTIAIACLFALVAGALAATAPPLPTFKSDLIVPNKSVAGIPLHGSFAALKHAFHSGGARCKVKTGCSFDGPDGATLVVLFAATVHDKTPFVGRVAIIAGTRQVGSKEVPVFDSSLDALKTASGIGLGSTAKALKAAYPTVKAISSTAYELKGKLPDYSTIFSLVDGRVNDIEVSAAEFG